MEREPTDAPVTPPPERRLPRAYVESYFELVPYADLCADWAMELVRHGEAASVSRFIRRNDHSYPAAVIRQSVKRATKLIHSQRFLEQLHRRAYITPDSALSYLFYKGDMERFYRDENEFRPSHRRIVREAKDGRER